MRQAVEKKEMEAAVLKRETEEKLKSYEAAMKQTVEKKEMEAVVLIRETDEKLKLTKPHETGCREKGDGDRKPR